MTQIIGFAGKKQSGKNTACNFIVATKLAEVGISRRARLSQNGEIEITDIMGETVSGQEWFSFKAPYVDVAHLFNNELGRFIKTYAFAEKLKILCVELLGLQKEWVFGTDQQKNTLTHIMWDSLPVTINKEHASGPMTAREVLQFVGTDMFRGLDSNVWVSACLRQIESDSAELALISDVRFENEVKAIQDKGGFVIGLKRSPYKQTDQHASETQVDNCLDICDTVIDNNTLSIPQQNEQIYLAIQHLTNVPNIIGD